MFRILRGPKVTAGAIGDVGFREERAVRVVAIGRTILTKKIDQWTDQGLAKQRRTGLVATAKRGHGSEIASGAIASDEHSPRVEAEPACIGVDPA